MHQYLPNSVWSDPPEQAPTPRAHLTICEFLPFDHVAKCIAHGIREITPGLRLNSGEWVTLRPRTLNLPEFNKTMWVSEMDKDVLEYIRERVTEYSKGTISIAGCNTGLLGPGVGLEITHNVLKTRKKLIFTWRDEAVKIQWTE